MRIHLTVVVAALVLLGSAQPVKSQTQGWDESPYIYIVTASDCRHAPSSRTLSGFRVKGTRGIVTALHGVADCKVINAASSAPDTDPIEGLKLSAVNIKHDAALLDIPQRPDVLPNTEGLDILPAGETVESMTYAYVVGHPYGIFEQRPTYGLLIRKTAAELLTIIPLGNLWDSLYERESPDLSILVFDIQGTLVPGHSGAPIFNAQDQVIGIGNGGLKDGATEFVWAVRWSDIVWQAVDDAALADLGESNPAIFAFPQDLSALPQGWVRVQVSVSKDNNRSVIEQVISTTENDTYLVPIPLEVDLSDADITISRDDTELGTRRVLAVGRVNGTITSSGGCAIDYRFNANEHAGSLLLTVEPVSSSSGPASEGMMWGCVYDSRTSEPIHRATVTATLMLGPAFPIPIKVILTDSEGYFVLPNSSANSYGLIEVAAEGYELYSRHAPFISGRRLRDFYLIPAPTPTTPTTPTPTPVEASLFFKDERSTPARLSAWRIREDGTLRTDRVLDNAASMISMIAANDEWLFFKDERFSPARLSAWRIREEGTLRTDWVLDNDASAISMIAASGEWLFFKDGRSNPARLSAWRIREDGTLRTDWVLDYDASTISMIAANDEWLFFKDERSNPARLSAWRIREDGTLRTDRVVDTDASMTSMIAASDEWLFFKDERFSPARLSVWRIREDGTLRTDRVVDPDASTISIMGAN